MRPFLLAIAETQASLPPETPAGDPLDLTSSLLKLIVALVVVCALAYLIIRYLLPRASFAGRAQNTEIEILERFGLEPRKNLYLLKVRSQTFLVGTAENTVSCLGEIRHDPPHS